MKKFLGLLLIFAFALSTAQAQKKIPHTHRTCNEIYNRRTEIILPQVKGFNIYKADLHIHTSYSDGRVTPAERVNEAWRDGLDIIAITDHYEGYRNVKKMLKVTAGFNENGQPAKYQSAFDSNCLKMDFNAIHNEAIEQRDKSNYDMLIIKGCEMARNSKTHGHFNCLFLSDINVLYDKELEIAFDKVHAQGGLVIHNHPSYVRGTTDKSEFHEKVYSAGKIDGVEVANGFSYYPPIVRRCVEEKLFMLGCSDEHGTTQSKYGSTGNLRTMTLIFAKDKSEKSIKDALLKRRTIAYSGGQLIGEEQWLAEYANAAIDCRLSSETAGKKDNSHMYTLTNMSSIPLCLRRGKTIYVLEPFKTLTTSYSPNKKGEYGTPKFTIENMWHLDYKHPVVTLTIDK
jgi:histidinol phosphatase-like PHP family hydrolase